MKLRRQIKEADVINLGSLFAFCDFCYEDCSSKGVNLAHLPQYLDYDLKFVEKFGKDMQPGTPVLIVLADFIFAVSEQRAKEPAEAFYRILFPWEIEHFSIRQYINAYYRAIRHLVACLLHKTRRLPPKMDEKEKKQAIYDRARAWEQTLGVPSTKTNQITENLQFAIQRNIVLLDQLITKIQQNNCDPYIIIPPSSKEMNEEVTQECMNRYLYEPLQLRSNQKVPVLDYMHDSDFQDLESYTNGFCLNQKGAKAFTKRVLQDIKTLKAEDGVKRKQKE